MRPLTTDRLLIRPWVEADRDFIFDMYSRWDVQRFLGRQPQVMTSLAEAEERIARAAIKDTETLGVSAIVRRADDQPVGSALLKPIPPSQGVSAAGGADDIEIGWHLHPDAWGHGYATEAARAVLDHAFAAGVTEVVAVTYPDNLASQRVARRIGMRHVGRTDRYYDTVLELFSSVPGSVPG